MELIILSDIHGNLSALEAVVEDFKALHLLNPVVVILGDVINYGMRPNEVIETLRNLEREYKVIIKIFGNHEKALIDGDTTRFSTDRGRAVLDYTRQQLTPSSLKYISEMESSGRQETEIEGKKILFLHGNIEDPYWGKLNYSTLDDLRYSEFDFVISGHSHIPHLIEKFYDADAPEYRNKKKTIFINPGSVGQPRNHNPKAQYAVLYVKDEEVLFLSDSYNVEKERSLFIPEIDPFYSDRLKTGI